MASPRRRTKPKLGLIVGAVSVVLILGAIIFMFASPAQHVPYGADDSSEPALSSAAAAAAPAPPSSEGGFLDPTQVDTAALLPAPPAPGSARYDADRKVFLATRALKGSARWALAASDDDQSVPATLHDFSCAVDVNLDPADAPAMVSLLTRVTPDVARRVDQAKRHFNRKRPYLVDAGDICTAKTDALAQSPDYPSGHATWGWMTALLLAELAPDRATPVLIRGRAYGESRVICGVHTQSAVEAGRINAAGLVAALHASAAFNADLELARTELAGLRQQGQTPDPGACATEAGLTAAAYY
jgi:acid phosphatase (class A)